MSGVSGLIILQELHSFLACVNVFMRRAFNGIKFESTAPALSFFMRRCFVVLFDADVRTVDL